MKDIFRPKTKTEIADEYGINRRTLQRWLKKDEINLYKGLLKRKELALIDPNFGLPLF